MEKTREGWLMEATEIFRSWFDEHAKPLPEQVRVSVGFPKGKRKTTIGICHHPDAAADGIPQMFISPAIADPIQVLATLLHELIHAADRNENGHRAEFGRVARALGLEGKLTATVPGDDLTLRLKDVLGKIGDYPHSALATRPRGSVGSRMLKATCSCGYTIRLTRKWADIGLPTCVCGEEMEMA